MSGWSDKPLGSFDTYTASELGARCAHAIMEYARPRAVTIDPEGRVWVEPVAEAAECDLVGVYARGLGVLELSRRISEDLRWEHGRRAATAKPTRRVVLSEAGRRQRGAA